MPSCLPPNPAHSIYHAPISLRRRTVADVPLHAPSRATPNTAPHGFFGSTMSRPAAWLNFASPVMPLLTDATAKKSVRWRAENVMPSCFLLLFGMRWREREGGGVE